MAKPEKRSSRQRSVREPKGLRGLREAIGLDSSLGQSLAWHVRNGLADYERAHWPEYDSPLELEDAPDEWFAEPEPLGYVTIRVLREAKSELTTPVAQFFLSICDPGESRLPVAPGIGLAWLHVARNQATCPMEPARLLRLAMDNPKAFFLGVEQDELPELGRLILSVEEPVEVWHLHALLFAVEKARIHVRASYRLFHSLMGADWIPGEAKRDFCRGVLRCSPFYERLRERGAALISSIRNDPAQLDQIPLLWLEVAEVGLDIRVPALRRHAVVALVDAVGESAQEVIDEFLLRREKHGLYEEMVHQGALDVVRGHAESLGPETVRQLLGRAIQDGSAVVRQAAYRIGLEQFGPSFARAALEDSAKLVRNWAVKALARDRRVKQK